MMDDFHMMQQLLEDCDDDELEAELLFHDAIMEEAASYGMSDDAAEFLAHYGMPHIGNIPRSGRYAWGSGENPYQGLEEFQSTVKRLEKAGMSSVDIAKHLGLRNTSQLKAKKSVASNELYKYRSDLAVKLKKKGLSNVAIAKRIFHDGAKENTVRNMLAQADKERKDRLQTVMDTIKAEIAENHYVNVGPGVELWMNITESRLNTAVEALRDEGYQIAGIRVPQFQKNNGDMTTIKVITDDPRPLKQINRDLYLHPDLIKQCGVHYEDKTDDFHKLEPPRSVDSKRLKVLYAEDNGTAKDGVIQIRRGCEDLDLGKAHYAQVRIAVDGTHYLKGMAIYMDDETASKTPKGIDIIFNSNKHVGTPLKGSKDNTVLKPMDDDPYNPFGATIRTQDQLRLIQRHYIDKNGKTQLNCLNIVNEEGNWREWSRTISAQMLSKQPPELAKRQLKLTYEEKYKEFQDILGISNPVLRKIRLEEFASGCDSAAVHLDAHGFPRQMSQVILPLNTLKDNEIYAPNFKDGEEVVLIRYPHASIAEIPSLVVNNGNKEGKRVLGRPVDGVGINTSVAQHLSGADFDGDTVIVIPNSKHDIRFKDYFEELKGWDAKEEYRGYEGMKKMTKSQRGKQMGIVTNLITDMTAQDAPPQDIIPAIKHSMVVIDAYKHGLDWKRSEAENHIQQLKAKYQQQDDGHIGGATTLFSRATSEVHIPHRRYKGYDPETGEKIWEDTGHINRIPLKRTVTNKETGKKEEVPRLDENGNRMYKEQLRLITSTRMAEEKDAFKLVSRYRKPVELVYAQYANDMKALGNTARKAAAAVKMYKRDPAAAAQYDEEVKSIMRKLKKAYMNKPLERQAQILTDAEIKIRKVDNNEMTKEEEKKLKNRLFQQNRYRVGAYKNRIELTEDEKRALDSYAISPTKAHEVFANMDTKYRNSLFLPQEKTGLSTAQIHKAERMLARGATQGDVAAELGISVDTLLDNVTVV